MGEIGDVKRLDYTLALHRESPEYEHQQIERRMDAAYEHVYQELETAKAYLKRTLNRDGRRALKQLEESYNQAVAIAARSGIGLAPTQPGFAARILSHAIPNAAGPIAPSEADPDRVLQIQPCEHER